MYVKIAIFSYKLDTLYFFTRLTQNFVPNCGKFKQIVSQLNQSSLSLTQVNSVKSYIKENFVTKMCKMLPLRFFHKTPQYGVYGPAWTPAISFGVIWTPGAKFLVKGSLGPKFKNLHFSHKTPQYECVCTVYGLDLDPSNQF